MSSVSFKEKKSPAFREEVSQKPRVNRVYGLSTGLFFLAVIASLIWLSAPDKVRESKAERLAFLVERIKEGHKLSHELRAELCSLWQEIHEGEPLTDEECKDLTKQIFAEEIDSFLTAMRPCAELIKERYRAELVIAENGKGFLLHFDTSATVIEIRLMHKSSGAPQFKKGLPVFRVRSDKHYLDETGTQGSLKETHYYFTECPEGKIHQIIKKHIAWRRSKGKHIREN